MKTTIILAFLFSFALTGRSAEALYLSPTDAPKHGLRVELVTPKPGIVQVTLHFTNAPTDVALVIRDAKNEFIATDNTVIHDKSCTVTLSEPYASRSYFLVPNSAKAGETQIHLSLR